MAATHGRRRSARPGRVPSTLPTLALGRYLDLEATTDSTRVCDDNELIRPAARRDIRPADRPCGRASARCRSCSATGTARGAGTCGSATTATTTGTAASSSGASSPGSRRASTREADGWQHMELWGMGIASQDLTGDRYPEVYLTSQGDNKLQTLADGPAHPQLPGHRARARRDRPPPVRRRHDAPLDGVAPAVRGRQQ